MTIDEVKLLDLMESGKIRYQDVIETSVLQTNLKKDWWKFGIQVLVSSTALVFSLTMSATTPGKEGVYLPIVTGILGYWLPSPEVPRSTTWKSIDPAESRAAWKPTHEVIDTISIVNTEDTENADDADDRRRVSEA